MSTSRPRTPVSARLNSLVDPSSSSSRPPGPRTSEVDPHPSSNPNPVRDDMSRRPLAAAASKLSATRALAIPEPALLRTARNPNEEDVDAQSLPDALREALSDEDAFLAARRQLATQAHTHANLAAAMRHPPSFLSLPGLTGAPYLDHLTRVSLPNISAASFSSLARAKSVDAHSPSASRPSTPTAPTTSTATSSALDSLRAFTTRDRGMHTSAPAEASATSPTRWWFHNKREVDRILDESDQEDTIEGEEQGFHKKYAAPRLPVVFCHGLLGFDKVSLGPVPGMQISHWRGILEVLQANGAEVLITRVPATSSPSDRAKVLAQKIEEVYPGREVHLIGHSMGGLDCRYVASQMVDRDFSVKSVTTIATPHRGSSFADHFMSMIGGPENVPTVMSFLDMLPIGGGDGSAFKSLTIESMRQFNELVLDAPGVQYFSWGATFEPGLLEPFKYSHGVILQQEGPNDGLVSVESAKWGTYLGTLEGVNHLDLVGWVNQARYKWADFMGRSIPFKPGTFYLGVCDHIARVVEGQGPADAKPKLEQPAVQAEAGISTKHRTSGDQAQLVAADARHERTPSPPRDNTATYEHERQS